MFVNSMGLFDHFVNLHNASDSASNHSCINNDVNCGEAGCIFNEITKQPECLCPDGNKPNDRLQCNDDTGEVIVLYSPKGDTFSAPQFETPQTTTDPSQTPHLYVILPVAISLVLLILVTMTLVLVIVRRRHRYNRRRQGFMHGRIKKDMLHKQYHSTLLDGMPVVGKNCNYSTYDHFAAKLGDLKVTSIPRDKLKLMEEIGEGAFGKVFKGTVTWSNEDWMYVAVKVLKHDASHETQNDFVREVKVMTSFSHQNILSLIGIVKSDTQSPLMVFELMEHGDLTQVLRKCDPARKQTAPVILMEKELVDIATQIANGMCYLASQHFVHRDLATRNCLVGAGLVVKISDFGMSRDIYTCDYYRIGGSCLLPVRWMSPESIKYGCFTSEGDVWSFGVTLWEIFSYGKQPYYGHSNEDVIRLLDDGILLQRTDTCPDEVYHVMLGCWRTDPKDRFKFSRIHNHLHDIKCRETMVCYQSNPVQQPSQITLLQSISNV